jgi:hypothetical protein
MIKYKLENAPKTICKKDAKYLEMNGIVVLKGTKAIWILNSVLYNRMKRRSTEV